MTDPSLALVLDAAISSRLRGLHTAAPGEIISYDHATQTATVQIAVELEIARGVTERIAPLRDVRIAWPRAGATSLHLPLSPGDGVLVVFSEQDPSAWLSGVGSAPQTAGRHGLFPFAIPGISPVPLPPTATSPTDAVLSCGALAARVGPTGVQLGTVAAADPIVVALRLKAAVAAAAAAAVTAAISGDGGAAAFTAFASTFADAAIEALNARAD